VLFGLAPALGATRASLSDVLKTEPTVGRLGIGRRALVVTQIALALVLLVGSGLLMRSLVKLLTVDVGFDASNVRSWIGFVPYLASRTWDSTTAPRSWAALVGEYRSCGPAYPSRISRRRSTPGWTS
jgi:hypothetical protein